MTELLNFGADLNFQNSEGNTPLHVYVQHHTEQIRAPVLEKLLEHHEKIDFNIRTKMETLLWNWL